MNKTQLSKTMSYILRHHPQDFGLELEIDGTVAVPDLVQALQQKFDNINKKDIEKVVQEDEKGRFSFLEKGKKIRANYGHSVEGINLDYEPIIPPSILYHGTASRFKNSILKEGLKSMNRRYTHLSETYEEAEKVGKRRDPEPVIFKVEARRTYTEGHDYFKTGKGIYLTDEVPPLYLEEIK